jgi:CRP/FNR family transcriptional regulator, cyclic AMP receptor protein
MAPSDPKIELLRSIPLFAGCSRADIEHIAQLADEVDLPVGKVLMRQGDHGDEMFVIAAGSVTVEKDGRKIAERGVGDTIGDIALLSEGPRTATVTTATPARLFVLGHREFHSLMDQFPTVRMTILEGLAARYRNLDTEGVH